MNMILAALFRLLPAVLLGLAGLAAQAATTDTDVDGTMGISAQGCLQQLTTSVGDGENCMYDGGPSAVPAAQPFGETTGPYGQVSYYDSTLTPQAFATTPNGTGRSLYAPAPGDGKIQQVIDGTITVDDNGTPGNGADDLVSFTLVLTSPGGGDVIRHLGSSVVDRYTSMTQVLAARTVSSATANGEGGFDYVIGSEGFPSLLTFSVPSGNAAEVCNGQLFGSLDCGFSFATGPDPNAWTGTSAAGLGSLESNAGARTTGSLQGADCVDSISATGVASNDCQDSKVSFGPRAIGPNNAPGAGVTAEDVGWDQLVMRISTDATGKVTAAAGFDVQEYQTFGANAACGSDAGAAINCNSWISSYFTLDAAPQGVANADGPVLAVEGVATAIDVLDNDTGFADPVTVTISAQPTRGTAVVTGSPGNAAGISVTYTASLGESGADSFEYTVDDGSSSASATVTLNVVGAFSANDDTATTTRNQPVTINVGANDVGFGDTVTVAIDGGSFSAGGSATVTSGNGGTPAGVVVTYTPVAAAGTPTYVETFTYTIDDGVLPIASATVSVTVNNAVPVASDGTISSISTVNRAPTGASGTFTAPGTGGNLGNTGGSAAVTVTAQGTRGTATVAGSVITYTITDGTFLTGSDSFSYSITDADGETDSGTVTVNVADASPTIAIAATTVSAGQSSGELTPTISAGNGALAAHTLAVTTQASDGTCAVTETDGTGLVTYTPDDGFSGTDSCVVTLTDADGDAGNGTLNVTVAPFNEARGEVGGASALGPFALVLLLLGALRRRAGGRAIAVLAAAGLVVLGAGTAGAQDAGADVDDLDEIVVTARKKEEKLLEVPLAITAFDDAAIERSGIQNLDDVANLTPGLSFFNAFGENLPVPVIRGIAPTDIFGQNNAAVFVDGVYIAGREGLNFGQLDIERIEVVKGPQSALYGRTAFSGAINYVTKAPSDEFEARTTAEIGNRGKERLVGMVSGPLAETLTARLSVLYDDFDGSYDNPLAPQNDIGGYQFFDIQAKLRWRPVDSLDISLAYYKANDEIDESATVSLSTNCENRINDGNTTDRFQNFCGEVPDIEDIPGLNGEDAIPKVAQATGENRDLDRLNLNIEWDLYEHGTVSALTGYSKTEQNSVSDFMRSLGEGASFLYCDNAAAEDPEVPNSCLANPANERFFTGVYDRELGGQVEELSQELRFTSPQDQRLRYTAGAYWYNETSKAYPGGPISTRPLPAASLPGFAIGLPPFDPTAPNFAIGTAIFYTTFTDDGGIDPLARPIAKGDTEGWALFTGLDFDFTDTLTGRAELRLSQEAQEETNYRYIPCADYDPANCGGDDYFDLTQVPATPFVSSDGTCFIGGVQSPLADCSQQGSARFKSVTGRVGLDWQVTDEWLVYGSVAYGEKPGGLQLASVRVLPPGDAPEDRLITNTFDPEELTAYELGLKGTAFDGVVTLSSAVFYNDWKEIVLRQLLESDPASGLPLEQPTAFNVNAGDADVWGVEAEVTWRITDDLSARVTGGWADAELQNAAQDTYEQFPTFAPDGDVSGNKLLRQPEWMWSASADYVRAFSDEWEFYTGGDVSYQSGIYVGNDNQGWLPEHTYVNGRLGLRSGVYTFELWGRNIFDDNSATAAFRDIFWANTDNQFAPYTDQGTRPNFDDFVPLRYTVTYPRERTWGITATMRFGAAAN